jgi:hypothetical protein
MQANQQSLYEAFVSTYADANEQAQAQILKEAVPKLFPQMEAPPAGMVRAMHYYHTPRAINRLFLSQIIGNNFKLMFNGYSTTLHMLRVAMPEVLATKSGREMLIAVAEEATVGVDLAHVQPDSVDFSDYLRAPRFAQGMLKLQELARTSFGFDDDLCLITLAKADCEL